MYKEKLLRAQQFIQMPFVEIASEPTDAKERLSGTSGSFLGGLGLPFTYIDALYGNSNVSLREIFSSIIAADAEQIFPVTQDRISTRNPKLIKGYAILDVLMCLDQEIVKTGMGVAMVIETVKRMNNSPLNSPTRNFHKDLGGFFGYAAVLPEIEKDLLTDTQAAYDFIDMYTSIASADDRQSFLTGYFTSIYWIYCSHGIISTKLPIEEFIQKSIRLYPGEKALRISVKRHPRQSAMFSNN